VSASRQILASAVLVNLSLSSLSDVFQSVVCAMFRMASRANAHCIGEACSVVWHVARAANMAAASVPVHGLLESIAGTLKILMMFPIV
jgi:hypothetical protein